MRVVGFEVFVCRSPLRRVMWSLQPSSHGSPRIANFIEAVIVRLSSSNGLVGYGQTVGVRFKGAGILPVGEKCKRLLEDIVRPKILGRKLYGNVALWRELRNVLSGEAYGKHALAGVDIALWDLKGKSLGLPVYDLLGGAYRKTVRLYASKIPGVTDVKNDEEIELFVSRLRLLKEEGYGAFKIGGGLGVDADAYSVELAREILGSECAIMLDAGCAYNRDEAYRLGKRLEDFDVEWFEAPLKPEDIAGYMELTRNLDVKIATDVHSDPKQIIELLRGDGVDVILSDVTSNEGITQVKRISELADLFNVDFSIHAGWHISSIGYAASAHVASSIPNLNFQEGRVQFNDNPLGNPILKRPLKIENGNITVPEGPGLGIEINEEALSRYVVD